LPVVPCTVEKPFERLAPARDAARYLPIERLGWFSLSLVLLAFYSFVIVTGSENDNPYELGLRAIYYAPSCLLMGFGYMLMAFVSKRMLKVLLYFLPAILSGSIILLIARIYHPGVERIFIEIENSVGTFFLKLIH